MIEPLVSIVMPCYNSDKFLKQSIESVLAQTYKNWELIIVDDLSSDSSAFIISSYLSADPRVKLIRNTKNLGAAGSRNIALDIAEGRFVAFLDSDDYWAAEKLEIQVEFMLSKNILFSYTAYNIINDADVIQNIKNVPEHVMYSDLLKENSIGCLTAMYDRNRFKSFRMPDIRRRQDLGLWLKILKEIDYAVGIPMVLASYRVHRGSMTSNKLHSSIHTWNLYRNVEKLSLAKSVYFFIVYAFNGMKNRVFSKLIIIRRQ